MIAALPPAHAEWIVFSSDLELWASLSTEVNGESASLEIQASAVRILQFLESARESDRSEGVAKDTAGIRTATVIGKEVHLAPDTVGKYLRSMKVKLDSDPELHHPVESRGRRGWRLLPNVRLKYINRGLPENGRNRG